VAARLGNPAEPAVRSLGRESEVEVALASLGETLAPVPVAAAERVGDDGGDEGEGGADCGRHQGCPIHGSHCSLCVTADAAPTAGDLFPVVNRGARLLGSRFPVWSRELSEGQGQGWVVGVEFGVEVVVVVVAEDGGDVSRGVGVGRRLGR
jgi:hypothetical protein